MEGINLQNNFWQMSWKKRTIWVLVQEELDLALV
jgi:hypothetical protein